MQLLSNIEIYFDQIVKGSRSLEVWDQTKPGEQPISTLVPEKNDPKSPEMSQPNTHLHTHSCPVVTAAIGFHGDRSRLQLTPSGGDGSDWDHRVLWPLFRINKLTKLQPHTHTSFNGHPTVSPHTTTSSANELIHGELMFRSEESYRWRRLPNFWLQDQDDYPSSTNLHWDVSAKETKTESRLNRSIKVRA